MKKVLFLFTLLFVSTSSNAGFLTGVAVGVAASNNQSNTTSQSTPVTVQGQSCSCDKYSNGLCWIEKVNKPNEALMNIAVSKKT